MARKSRDEVRETVQRLAQELNLAGTRDLEEQKRKLIENGEDPKQAAYRAISYEALRKCCVKELHIGRWRAECYMDPQILGIQADGNEEYAKFLAEYIRQGAERLLPARYIKQLNSTENAAREYLRSHSIGSPWGRLVPFTVNREVNEKLAEYRERYFSIINKILEQWDELVLEMERYYRIGAAEAWRRLNLIPLDEPSVPPREWEDTLVRAVMSRMISRREFQDSCYFDVETFLPLTPSQILAEQVRLEKVESIVQQLDDEEKRIAAEAQKKIDEMYREATKDLPKMVDEFMLSMFRELRATVYEACVHALEQRQKNGKFLAGNRKAILRMVQDIRNWNEFLGEEKIREMLLELQEMAGEDVPEECLKESLTKVATLMRADLLDLGNTPRSAREVGIPDEIPPELCEELQRRQPRRQEKFTFNFSDDVAPMVPRRERRDMECMAI